jgi:hypothetical protein
MSVLLLAYIAWTEERIRELETVTDMVYDSSSVCRVGDSRQEVDKHLDERGYRVKPVGQDTEVVIPNLSLGNLTFRRFSLWIEYDKAGKVRSCDLESDIAAL